MMFETRHCPECGAEVTLRYHIKDKHFRIEDGKIVRDDAHQGGYWDNPELIFECSNDREHEIPNYPKWEDPITTEFFDGGYYDK
jgi:hypothetical protein